MARWSPSDTEIKKPQVLISFPEMRKLSSKAEIAKSNLDAIQGKGFFISLLRIYYAKKAVKMNHNLWNCINKKYPETSYGFWSCSNNGIFRQK